MSKVLAVLLDGIAQLEYHRDKPLPAHQDHYLQKMDDKMAQGIMIGDDLVQAPDINQCAQFVAANLAHAILSNQEDMTAALCTWLAIRLPELKQVKITKADDGLAIELDFDEEYRNQVVAQFRPLH